MKISLCMNTARDNYSMDGLPDIHIFEYLMKSLRKQTYKNFEVIIADTLYEERSGYFEENEEDFEIKHVPIKPNIWTPRKLFAISTTKNTCLLHATGDIIIFIDDCAKIHPENFVTAIEKLSKDKKLILCSAYSVHLGQKFLGWGLKPDTELRSRYNNNLATHIENFLLVNGYDEMFDDSRGYEDCDIILRLLKIGFHYEINSKPYNFQQHCLPKNITDKFFVRCCNLLWDLAAKRHTKQIFKANTISITDEEYKFISDICFYNIIEEGASRCSKFTHKETGLHHFCPYDGGIQRFKDERYKNLIKLYKHSSLTFDLKEQRKDIEKTLLDLKQKVEKI